MLEIPPYMSESVRPDTGSIEAVEAGLIGANYICNRQTATAIYLARNLRKPVLVEGPAGVGKTELARATAHYLDLPLIRMQCYEGLDESKALYEWKYGKQLLYTQILKDTYGASLRGIESISEALEKIGDFDDVFFSEQFLEARPLLAALRQENGAVLLVDEIDKSDQEFEAFLLEILSDFQVTIPEIGTIVATIPPLVVLTSNDSRDLGDALKRRCLHLHIGYPDAKLEERIIEVRVPGVEERLRAQIVAFVQKLRTFELKKLPSVSETIDWARALVLLHVTSLDADAVRDTLNVLLKYESDIESMKRHVNSILAAVN
jgi:MoxR-like ATPase